MRSIDHMKAFTAIFIVSLSFTLLIGTVQASSWTKESTPNDVLLTALDMVNSSDGWAVGSDGVIIHWDGNVWSNAESPTGAWFSWVAD